MGDARSGRVVFMSGSDGHLAQSLIRNLASPGVRFALQADYRKGIEQLIELARACGAEAVSINDGHPDPLKPLWRPSAERCVRDFGTIDLALDASLPDRQGLAPTLLGASAPSWWLDAWNELQPAAELLVSVAPLVARAGRVVLAVPDRTDGAGPLHQAAAAAFDVLVPIARAELAPSGVTVVTVPVIPIEVPAWQPFQPTPASLEPVVSRIVAAANG